MLDLSFNRLDTRLNNAEKKSNRQELEIENARITAEIAIRKLEWIKGYVKGYSDKQLKEAVEKALKEKVER